MHDHNICNTATTIRNVGLAPVYLRTLCLCI